MPVLTRAQPFDDLQAAINQESYRFLDDHAPELIEGIEAAIARGKTPEEIARFVKRKVSADRVAIVLRCEQAAAHVVARQAGT